jgi:uncharacterized RDD family membrane protein YckC
VRLSAGFWRRLGAFAIDSLLLGLAGLLIGLFAFDWLASLGGAGRLLGFSIALVYFGLSNSRTGHGQTLGKRLLGIEVIDLSGMHLSPARSAARFVVLGTPFFLNGAVSGPLPLAILAGAVIFGGGGAILYLFVFNRATRRSLHDLVCGTWVVRTQPVGAVRVAPLWRGHLWIGLSLVAVAVALSAFTWRLASQWKFPELLAVRSQLLARDDVADAGIFVGRSWLWNNGVREQTSYLNLTIQLRCRPDDYETAAADAVAVALAHYSDAKRQDSIAVTITYGYDIGIAHAWLNRSFHGSPEEWRRRTTAPAKPRPQRS